MKKALTLIAVILLALGCKKFNTSDGSFTIAFPQNSYELEAGDVVGFSIIRTPSSGKEPKYNFSSTNPDVAVVNGSNINAIGEGTTTIRASVKDDETIYCECTVKVIPKVNAREISSITLTKTSVEVSDLGVNESTADYVNVGVTLLPADANWSDVNVFSDDEDVQVDKQAGDPLSLKISVRPNSEHQPTNVRNVTVHVNALKGGIQKTVTVKVCGHVRSVSVPLIGGYPIDGGIIRLVRGNNYKINAILNTTGTLPSDYNDILHFQSSSTILNVAQDGTLTIPGGKDVTGGSGSPLEVYLDCIRYDEEYIPPIKIQVHTYEKPTGYTFSLDGGDSNVMLASPGVSHRLAVKSTPEKSLCYLNTSSVPTELQGLSIDRGNNINTIDFKAVSSTLNSRTLSFTSPLGSIPSWTFYIDDFTATEPKIGDFVYYNSSTGTFNWSDGGLRAINSANTTRYADGSTLNPVSGKGTLIGVIYDNFEGTSSNVRLVGLSGKHFKVCCVKDANVGQSGKYRYTNASCDIAARWTFESVYLPTEYQENTIMADRGIVAYNTALGSTTEYKIKVHYLVEALQENGSDRLPVKVGDSSTSGSSGWMLPLKKDAEMMISRKSIITHSSSINALSDTYWTASYDTSDKAYCFTNSKVSSVNRSLEHTTRAILIL
ncbi:MAG: Ig-like domain-containing protein [Bacteroidales bacterium]|nr:Ig-like domain-containing protein [Bacteroidales bacterium]